MALSERDWEMFRQPRIATDSLVTVCRMHLIMRRSLNQADNGTSFGFVEQSPFSHGTHPTFTVHINFSDTPSQGSSIPSLKEGMAMIEQLCKNVEGE